MQAIQQETHWLPIGQDKIHLHRIFIEQGPPVVLIHGSMEDGRIFYSKSLKGLAPFLAKQGFDVYVADLAGRGQSQPPANRKSRNDQFTAITNELPGIYEYVQQLRPSQAQHWMAHSWGGVLILSFLARFGKQNIASCTFFGTKRRISIFNWERLWKVDFFWTILGEKATWFWGYFPAKTLKFGSDNESTALYRQTRLWVYSKSWKDPVDQFDYAAKLQNTDLPPSLYLTGKNDRILGNPIDVKKLMQEAPHSQNQFELLSKENGHLKDYDHVNILTDPKAEEDHFPQVVKWIKQHGHSVNP